MAIVNGYVDLATIRARLGSTDTADDPRLESVITAVSRWIDAECGRFFFSANQTRYYTAENWAEVWIDDLLTLTSLKTDYDGDQVYETTWTATDYYLLPSNARLESPAQPYTHLRRAIYGQFVLPHVPWPVPNGIQIVGTWGFDTTVPPVISEACILQASRLWRRSDAPFGITGSSDMGQSIVMPRLDPDVRMMLAPYRRVSVA